MTVVGAHSGAHTDPGLRTHSALYECAPTHLALGLMVLRARLTLRALCPSVMLFGFTSALAPLPLPLPTIVCGAPRPFRTCSWYWRVASKRPPARAVFRCFDIARRTRAPGSCRRASSGRASRSGVMMMGQRGAAHLLALSFAKPNDGWFGHTNHPSRPHPTPPHPFPSSYSSTRSALNQLLCLLNEPFRNPCLSTTLLALRRPSPC